MPAKTGIYIIDDHSVVIEGIRKVLANEKTYEIVGFSCDGRNAVSEVQTLRPDIVILDVSMPAMDGLEIAHTLKSSCKDSLILVYSMSSSRQHITTFFREGVSAYVLKEEPLSELCVALNALREGGTFYSKAVQGILQDHMKELELGQGKNVDAVDTVLAKLSVREKEVFVLLADGLSVKEIAHRLCISHKTVETHKYNIMDKLSVNSLADFTKLALKKDLIEL